MQCPNCRKIEKGQWLYANGSRSLPEFSMEDWNHDEDLYDLSYSEMVKSFPFLNFFSVYFFFYLFIGVGFNVIGSRYYMSANILFYSCTC